MKIVFSHFDFVLGVPVQSLSTEPSTVHADFPDSIILYWYSVEHTFCQYMTFPTVQENMMSQQLSLRLGGHCSSQRTVQLVGCETIITINFEIFLKHKLLEFYYSSYYCCVSTTSETLCGQLCQAPHLPPSPFLSATSLPSPVLLQIFASRICKTLTSFSFQEQLHNLRFTAFSQHTRQHRHTA